MFMSGWGRDPSSTLATGFSPAGKGPKTRDAPDAEPILSQEVAMSLRTSIRVVSTVIALATASMIASVALASHHFALAIDAAVQLGR